MFLTESRWGTQVRPFGVGVKVRSGSRKMSMLKTSLNAKMSIGAMMGVESAGASSDVSRIMRAWVGIWAA